MPTRTDWVILLLLLGSTFSPRALADGPATPNDPFAVFRTAQPVKVWHRSLDQLAPVFSAFQHEPFDKAGFDPVVLPFLYSDPDGIGKSEEAAAFAFLLSYDLDWAPGCYCARHAYFVFKRNRALMQRMALGYTPARIAQAVAGWNATHAVGGVINRSRDGYSGWLRIYDPVGRVAFQKGYDTPETFFDLLGDMDVDAIAFFGSKPSAALAAYLHQPRCARPQSLAELGSDAFAAERTPQEFALYDRILRDDPDFAELRYWSANQQQWLHADPREYQRQIGLALRSRVNISALTDFSPGQCPDPEMAAQFPGWLDRADELGGGVHPTVLQARLRYQKFGAGNRSATYAAALKVAAAYPNSHNLLMELTEQTSFPDAGDYDNGLAASLYFASLQDRYLPGTGEKNGAIYGLADDAIVLGHPELAIDLLRSAPPNQPDYNRELLVEALCMGGQYEVALTYFQLLDKPYSEYTVQRLVPCAAFAAAVEHRSELLSKIIDENQAVLQKAGQLEVFQYYRDVLAGRKLTAGDLQLPADALFSDESRWQGALEEVLATNSELRTDHLKAELYSHCYPQDRLGWMIWDAYQRRDPSFDAATFYDYLQWLYGADPWVAAAVADFHKRSPGNLPPSDLTSLKNDLTIMESRANGIAGLHWEQIVTPWRIASAIHQLLRNGDISSASDLAEQNLRVCNAQHEYGQFSLAYLLMRRTHPQTSGH